MKVQIPEDLDEMDSLAWVIKYAEELEQIIENLNDEIKVMGEIDGPYQT